MLNLHLILSSAAVEDLDHDTAALQGDDEGPVLPAESAELAAHDRLVDAEAVDQVLLVVEPDLARPA